MKHNIGRRITSLGGKTKKAGPTPGPWKATKGEFNRENTEAWGSLVAKTKDGYYYVATIEDDPGFDVNGNEVNPEVNARLIAAAPEILEALMGCLDHLEYIDRNHPETTGAGVRYDRIAQAKMIIAKIEGGS